MAYVQQSRTANLYRIAFDPAMESAVGQPVPVTRGSREAFLVDISPDGQWVAFSSGGKQENIFITRTDGTSLRQLTDGICIDRMPRWSPDGKQLAFFSNRTGKNDIWSIKPDGSGLHQLTEDREKVQGPVWSPDGVRLAVYRQLTGETFLMDSSKPWSQQTPQMLPSLGQGSGYFVASSWSPDGRQLAGYGYRMGTDGALMGVVTYSFQSRQFQQLTEFGYAPRWFSDSRRLLFNHQGKLYLVDSRTKKVHEVLSVLPNELGPYHFGFSRDNRLIVFSMVITEADIWLANLEER